MRSMMRLTVVMAGLGAYAAAGAAVAPAWDASSYSPNNGDASNWDASSAGISGVGTNAKTQGYLGVDLRDVSDEQLAALKMKEVHGAEVTHVDHDGPAGKIGLREHDVILQMNGTAIEGEEQLRRMLRETPAGRTVTIIISRDGKQQTLTTQLANKLEVEKQAWEGRWIVPVPSEEGASTSGQAARAPASGNGSTSSGSTSSKGNSFFSPSAVARSSHNLIATMTGSAYTGALVENMEPQLAEFFGSQGVGVLVHSVDVDSPAAKAGLRAGDVVVRANTTKLTSSSDWMKVVRENRGKSVEVVVLRDKKEQTLTLVPDGKKRSSLEPHRDKDMAMMVVWRESSFD
jgi:serine protease Do